MFSNQYEFLEQCTDDESGIVLIKAKPKGLLFFGVRDERLHVEVTSLASVLGLSVERLKEIFEYDNTLKSSTGSVFKPDTNDRIASVLDVDAVFHLFQVLPFYMQDMDRIHDVRQKLSNALFFSVA